MTVSCTHAVQEKCSSWELRGSAQFSWCAVAACGLLCRLDWRLGERVWWEDRRICALVELRQKFYCVNAHGAHILTSNTRILKVQGARASYTVGQCAGMTHCSADRSIFTQQSLCPAASISHPSERNHWDRNKSQEQGSHSHMARMPSWYDM